MDILLECSAICTGAALAGELVRAYLRRALTTPRPITWEETR